MDCLADVDLPGRGHRVLGIHFLIMITRAGWGDPATDVLAQFHTVRASVALALHTKADASQQSFRERLAWVREGRPRCHLPQISVALPSGTRFLPLKSALRQGQPSSAAWPSERTFHCDART